MERAPRSCEDVRRDAHAFVAGDLSEADASSILGHLEGCAGCSERIEEARSLRSLLAGWNVPEPSPRFSEGVLDALRARRGPAAPAPPAPPAPHTHVRLPLALAIAASVLLMVSLAFNVQWLVLRQRLRDRGAMTRVPGGGAAATPVAAGPRTPTRMVRPAFYYFLDPVTEATVLGKEEVPAGP